MTSTKKKYACCLRALNRPGYRKAEFMNKKGYAYCKACIRHSSDLRKESGQERRASHTVRYLSDIGKVTRMAKHLSDAIKWGEAYNKTHIRYKRGGAYGKACIRYNKGSGYGKTCISWN